MVRTPDHRSLEQQLSTYDWSAVFAQLDTTGYAILPELLDKAQCEQLIAMYGQLDLFRNHIVMERHGYGRGEYQYFARPLPELIQTLRRELYARLTKTANAWMQRLGHSQRFPEDLVTWEQTCAASGQTLPTPLLLKYRENDENRLHQDMYGELHFPLQAVLLLSEPQQHFVGGEFVLTEQRPRMQSRVEIVPLARGDAAIFAGALRPVAGAHGDYRVKVRHGVSRVRRGERFALGIIFHDAQ